MIENVQLRYIPVAPTIRNSRYSWYFRTLIWSTAIFFTLLDRPSISHYNDTKIIKFGWEFFILRDISYWLSFSWCARFPEFEANPKMILDKKKILIKYKVFNQIWSWCHYNEEKKNVHQSKVLKKLTVMFFGAPLTVP